MMRAKVYVINKSMHDFTPAEEFGDLIFLTSGKISSFDLNTMARDFEAYLTNSSPEDFILLTSLASMCSVVSAMFAHKHGKVNFLIFDPEKKGYVQRTLVF